MSRWEVYSFLKQVNGQAGMHDLIEAFPEMSWDELMEGLTEYNMMTKKDDRYAECLA